MFERVLDSDTLSTLCTDYVRALIPLPAHPAPLASEELAVRASEKVARTGTMTEQARRLAAESLHGDLDDLHRGYSALDRTKPRAKDGLRAQRISPAGFHGLQLAQARGLALLIHDYQQQLLRREKELRRNQAAEGGPTGEDVDLKQRLEQLPLSPLLLQRTHVTLKSLSQVSVRDEL